MWHSIDNSEKVFEVHMFPIFGVLFEHYFDFIQRKYCSDYIKVFQEKKKRLELDVPVLNRVKRLVFFSRLQITLRVIIENLL
jgi:hypothetical protein